ncbi:unnamed protein product, partial [Adineta steineri]
MEVHLDEGTSLWVLKLNVLKLTVAVDAIVYSRIVDPVASVTKVERVQSATQLLAQTSLRNMLGTKTLQEILSDREAIANQMEVHLDEGTS